MQYKKNITSTVIDKYILDQSMLLYFKASLFVLIARYTRWFGNKVQLFKEINKQNDNCP